MKDQFYYKTKGKVYGPVRFGVLVSQLRKGELALTDSVRTQGSSEWQRVDYLMKSLIDQFPEIAGAAEVQEKLRGSTKPNSARRSSRAAGGGISSVGAVGGLFGLVGKGIEEAVLFVANFFEVLFSGFGKKHAIILLLIAGWIGLNGGYYLWSTPPSYTQEIENYRILGEVWSDLQKLREEEASPEEWSAFEAGIQPKIDAMVSDLEQGASTTDPIRMQLLWVSRDFLPKMLVDAREERSHSETLYEAHMRQAARLLTEAGQQVQQY